MMMSLAMNVSMGVLHLFTHIVVAFARVQDAHLDKIEDKAHCSNNEHNIALDRLWLLVAP